MPHSLVLAGRYCNAKHSLPCHNGPSLCDKRTPTAHTDGTQSSDRPFPVAQHTHFHKEHIRPPSQYCAGTAGRPTTIWLVYCQQCLPPHVYTLPHGTAEAPTRARHCRGPMLHVATHDMYSHTTPPTSPLTQQHTHSSICTAAPDMRLKALGVPSCRRQCSGSNSSRRRNAQASTPV
jgi:hypothetical protein